MPSTPSEIIRQHKEHLLRRLVSNSPLLKFRPHGQRVMSVHDLFENITQNLPRTRNNTSERIGCQSPSVFLHALLDDEPDDVRITNPAKPVFTKCRLIAELNRDYHSATGGWALYLGYPLVFVRRDSARIPFWAPLFFWKIKITAQGGVVTFARVSEENEPENPDFNRVLASWIMKEKGIKIKPPDTESVRLEELSEIVRKILDPWRECETQFFNDIEPEPFVKPENDSPDVAVYPYATLGYGEIKYQSLLNDLDALSNSIDPENCGCSNFLLCPRNDEQDNEAKQPEEVGKISITDSDTSQENAIWQARESGLTVLQGPPGTGKSQTIVNLIANALYRREKVAVICEKEPALNVVLKRMEANGLRSLAAKITQPRKDRKKLIKSIQELNANDSVHSDSNKNHRLLKSKEIEKHEKVLDDFHQRLQSTDGKLCYGDILAHLDSVREDHEINIREPRFNLLRKAISKCFRGDLREVEKNKKEIDQFVKDFKDCDYDNNPWRELTQENPNAQDLRAILSELMDDSATLESVTPTSHNSLHGDAEKWFAEHSLAVKLYPGMTGNSDIQRQYGDFLCKSLDHLGEYLPHSVVSVFLAEYRNGGHFKSLQTCQTHLDTLESLLIVRRQLRDNKIIQELRNRLISPTDNWRHYFFAMALLNWLGEHPPIPVDKIRQIEQSTTELKDSLQEKQKLDRSIVAAQFSQKLTAHNKLQQENLLRINGSRQNRKTTIRDLYGRGFNSLTKIYPVLLANPDSACQILPLTPGLFDLLIIDEASQMFTADALSLLYRAKRTVISGDKMQMPPSDFFSLSTDDIEGDGEDEADQKLSADANRRIPADGEYNLLDAAEYAISKGAPNRKTLEVHYRSRTRELIDFSNRAFYDGKLQIPPGNFSLPSFLPRPITLEEVKGKFSGSVNNDEIIKIISTLKKIWGNSDDYSIGVIVFNTAQRDALIDMLANDPDENFLAQLAESRKKEKDGEFEGFFVRSVEHVQGDERDIIILGTTYDSDKRNYGPIIRREKGRRRLNVAVTRAKVGMFVITSLNIDQISNQGEAPVSDEAGQERERWFLWMYMKYARAVNGDNPVEINAVLDEIAPPPPRPPLGKPESEFERQVGEFLREKGYTVEYQVGESGFRIDLGVKYHENTNYLCGIECDGAPFHSGWRARYRDSWREDILKKKGWKIYRVWSTRWFHSKETEQNKLLEYLRTQAACRDDSASPPQKAT